MTATASFEGQLGASPTHGGTLECASRSGLVWWVCREVEDRERYWGRERGRRRYCDFSEVLEGVSWNFWGGADIPLPGGV